MLPNRDLGLSGDRTVLVRLTLVRTLIATLCAMLMTSPAVAETWYRADTHHFVIYSNGGERQLEEFAHKTERFDALLRIFFRREPELQPNRLTIYLVSKASTVDRLLGPKRSNVAGFYHARTEGSYAVANREKARNKFDMDGQTVLFHEYAHHFMARNFPVPAPAWFVEGFAEYAATADFKRNGAWTFGEVANHRAYSLMGSPQIPIRTLLVESASGKHEKVFDFYAWAWALTHMMYQSDERGAQIGRYLSLLAEGEEPLAAAEQIFGDLDALEKRLDKYVNGPMTFTRSETPFPYMDDIKITPRKRIQV